MISQPVDLGSESTTIKSAPRVTVLGLGGAGCNTVHRLSTLGIMGIELIAANTDRYSLNAISADQKIFLGSNLTSGLGSGGNPEMGKLAAEESYKELIAVIKNSDLLFLTAGMGGGTGSGAIQIAARIAKSLDVPSISIVTVPFAFEAGRRQHNAYEAISALQPFTDTLITIPNDRLIQIASANTTLETAFSMSDDILLKSIQGISEMFSGPGLLDVDFSHIMRLMKKGGGTYISIGFGQGEERVIHAIENAVTHPLLENIQIQQACGIIAKFSGNLSIKELEQAMQYLRACTAPDTEIIPALNPQERLDGGIMATLLVTGIGATPAEYPAIQPERVMKMAEKENELESSALPLDVSPHAFDPVEKDLDDLEVPAFIRRGYNQLEHSVFPNG